VPDDSLLELERSLRANPDDASLRFRLASALARSGRRGEALAHVDVARAPAEHFQETRRLADELWRSELLELDRAIAVPGAQNVTHVALDQQGSLVAWSHQERLCVAGLETGAIVHENKRHVSDRIVAAQNGFFSHDRRKQRIVRVEWLKGNLVPSQRNEVPRGTRLIDASPAGDRLLLQGDRQEGVYRWPSLEPVFEQPSRAERPMVDWTAGLLVSPAYAEIHVVPLDGSDPFAIGGARGALTALGSGVFARKQTALALHGIRPAWTRELLSQAPEGEPSLSSDRRGLRLFLGGKPVRFDLDITTGEVLSAPEGVDRLSRVGTREDTNILWHPHADLVLHRKNGVFELRGLEGPSLRRLPGGASPQGWTADGRALLVLRSAGSAGEGKAWIELWRPGGSSRGT
jgi:hypothetical protein